jgi:hypothetical protein
MRDPDFPNPYENPKRVPPPEVIGRISKEEPPTTFEPPEKLDEYRIVHWSKELKKLEGVKQGGSIRKKALAFLRHKCVVYDKENKQFIVKPIKVYNKQQITVKPENGHLACNCQFYNVVSKNWEHPICSHSLAVKMWLEIKRWNKEDENPIRE